MGNCHGGNASPKTPSTISTSILQVSSEPKRQLPHRMTMAINPQTIPRIGFTKSCSGIFNIDISFSSANMGFQ
jgi:hypothetical protein